MKAPKLLISRVLPSSMNCSPCGSSPRTKSGTCKRIRGERRCSSVNEARSALGLTRVSLSVINASISTRADALFQLQVRTHWTCCFANRYLSVSYKVYRASSRDLRTRERANLRQFISTIVQSGTHLPLTPPNPFASIRVDPIFGPKQRGVFRLIGYQRSESCPRT